MIIVGAGLSGLITAWRCLDLDPGLKVTVVEASGRIAGDHTWSFHLSDIPQGLRDWIKPFIACQWPRYDVRFPEYTRTLEIPYCTGNSDRLRACVQPFIDEGRLHAILNTEVSRLKPDHVVTGSGERLDADRILDARGFRPDENVFLGYQKFVGHSIRMKAPHGLKHPIIMDATVAQSGGYRFVYCLPFSAHEVLVEDTCYADGLDLDVDMIDARITSYINDCLGGNGYALMRRETGVLPITLAVDGQPYDDISIGIRGGFFHAATGYSLPDAVWVAHCLATKFCPDAAPVASWHPDTSLAHFGMRKLRNEKFFRLLNRMLFRAAKPEERYKILQRFYKLDEDLIKRFYAGALTGTDRLRILFGKPPVPIRLAMYNFSERAFIRRERRKRKEPS
ncbi:MAG: lycopene beta-cyclase CrtY [Hyphomonadaceae bacterium]|nr:lycopene beta-cyclase CrtY [Hyphomonadaceae bacterium]